MEFTITEDVPVLDHNKFTKWQVGGADVSNTITISGTTVITANWIAKVESTLTYDKGTATGTNIVTNDVEESTNVTLPAIGSGSGQANFTKDGYDFVGWLYEGTLYKSGETFVMPAVDATLVAQWKKQNIEKFALVTDASLLIDGMKVVLAFNDDADGTQKDNIAGELHSNGYLYAVSATFANNEVTVEEGAVVFTLETASNGWKLRKDGNNYLTSSGADLKWDNAANATIWTISFDDSDVKIANGSNIIQFNYSSPRFKTYTSTQRDIQLYASQTIIANNASITEIGYVQGDVIIVNENKTLTIDEPITPEAIIVKEGATVTASSAINANSVIVEDGGNFNANSTSSVIDLTIEAGGHVNVAEDQTLAVNDFTIESAAGKSGQLIQGEDAEIQVTGDIYMDITFYKSAAVLDATSASQWYMISAPFDVNLADGFINPVSGVTMHRGNDDNVNTFDLFYYDGQKRANTGTTGWTRVQGQMPAGRACLIGFNAGQSTTIRLKAASNEINNPTSITLTGNTSTVGETDQEKSSNSDWNGVANPTFHYTDLDKDAYIWNNEEGENGRKYNVYSAGSCTFVVGTPLFIQGNTSASLTAATNTQFRAPKREVNERIEYCVRITREGANDFADQMYVRASEEASATYERGHDLIAWNGTSGKSALLWSENYGMRLAIEEAPLANNGAIYTLGIFAPNAGEYVISTPTEDEDATLYLTLNGHIIWNLSQGAYTAELQQGQNSGYGLKIVAAPKVSTGIENSGLMNDANGVQKVIIDEHVFILRGGQMYDVNGKMVK